MWSASMLYSKNKTSGKKHNKHNHFLFEGALEYYAIFSVSFVLIAMLSFSWFYLNQKQLLWSLDGFPVLLPSFLHQNRLPLEEWFNYSLGWGSDGYSFFASWYFEPFQFLASLIVDNPGITMYSLVTILKLYTAGITFSVYCIRNRCTFFATYISAIAYSFSVFSLYIGIRFPTFLVAMIYLPLLLLGIDVILEKGFSYLFVVMVALSAISHIYFFYINTLFCVIYCVMRLALTKGVRTIHAVKKTFICMLHGLLGMGIASFVLMPNLINLFQSNRSEVVISTPSLLSYGDSWISTLLAYIPAPMTTIHQPHYEFYIGVIPLAAVCLMVYLFSYTTVKQWKAIAIVLFCFMLFPFFAYMFCAFSNISNRWSYLWVFTICYCTALILCKKSLSDYSLFMATIIVAIFASSLFLHRHLINMYTVTGLFGMCFFLVLLLQKKMWFEKRKSIWCIIMAVSAVGMTTLYSMLIFSPSFGNYIEEFASTEEVDTNMSIMNDAFEKTEIPYRVEFCDNDRRHLGLSYLNGFASTGFYSNSIRNHVADYLKNIECAGFEESIINYDMDSRTTLMELLSVKYYVVNNSTTYSVPFGYRYDYTFNSQFDVFINENYIAPIYTYVSYMDELSWRKLDSVYKEQILLDAAVLKETTSGMKKFTDTVDDLFLMDSYNVEIDYVGVDEIVRGKYYSEYDNSEIQINVKNTIGKAKGRDKEYYLQFKGFNIDDDVIAHWNISVLSFYDDGRMEESSFAVLSKKNNYNPQVSDYTIRIGRHQGELERIIVRLPYNGNFSFDEINVKSVDLSERISDKAISLTERVADISFGDNKISFKINTNQPCAVCVGIPYSDGWNAVVDGNDIEVKPINIAFLGFELDVGEHEVVLEYSVPGLTMGRVISVVSLVILFVISILISWQKKDPILDGFEMIEI